MITISRESASELNSLLEDTVEYFVTEAQQSGELISGETAWKLIAAYAATKEAEFQGMFN